MGGSLDFNFALAWDCCILITRRDACGERFETAVGGVFKGDDF